MNAFQHTGGGSARATSLGDLFAFSHRRGGQWRHPWFTQAFWNSRAQQWVATMEPGFINAYSPRWTTTIREQADSDRVWHVNPLTGQPFFSDPISAREQRAAELRTIDVPLYLGPAIPLGFRNVGLDGSAQYPVPAFFQRLGVLEPIAQPDALAVAAGTATLELPTQTRGARLLRACDLWVRQPRLALTSEITLEPGIATGTSNVTQRLGVRGSFGLPRLFAGTLPVRVSGIDPLAGVYEEPTWDDLLICTVFLLSPPNAPLYSAPDASWQPFTRHSLFWNLAWDQPDFRVRVSDGSGVYIPPIGAGAGQIVINFLTASINDLTNQAINILNGQSLAGRFWTCTGGGHTAAPLETSEESSATGGLDKAARNAARARTATLAQRNARLDPVFPHRAEPFDLSLLSAA